MSQEPATQSTPSEDDRVLDACWEQRCATLHRSWVQVRYHRRRQRFFDLVDKITKSLTVLLGASLLGQGVKDHLPMVAAAISALGLLALVFGYGDRKQLHKELAQQASSLVAAILLVPAGELTPAKTAIWGAEYAKLCAKAPPALKVLTIICEHEQASAEGHTSHIQRPHFLARLIADFIS